MTNGSVHNKQVTSRRKQYIYYS